MIELLLGQNDVWVSGEVGEGQQAVEDDQGDCHHSGPCCHHQACHLPHLVMVHAVGLTLLFCSWIIRQEAEAENRHKVGGDKVDPTSEGVVLLVCNLRTESSHRSVGEEQQKKSH